VDFTVSEPTPFSLSGLLEIEELLTIAPGSVDVSLAGPSGPVFDLSLSTSNPGDVSLALDEQGVLAPGAYSFVIEADIGGAQGPAGMFGFGGEGRYDLVFQVPTPGVLAAAPLGAWLLVRRRR
jgi:hypothetical protein